MLHRGNQFGVGAQPLDKGRQPRLVLQPHRVIALGQHVAHLVQHRGAELVGQVVGQLGHVGHQLQRADDLGPLFAGMFEHQLRHLGLDLVLQQIPRQLVQTGIKQFVVAAVLGQQPEHVAGGGRGIPAVQLRHDQLQRGFLQPLVVKGFNQAARPALHLAHPERQAFGVNQPLPQAARRVERGDFGQNRRRV